MNSARNSFSELFELAPHGPDVYVGIGPQYPWGGLYGGQIVAQALRAATMTVDDELAVHSIRAYFIRRGDHKEPVRYEVDRIRNGRSFATRRVVARQAIGAILNAESSFQRPEESPVVQTVEVPSVPSPDGLEQDSWSDHFSRAFVPADAVTDSRDGLGRSTAWFKVNHDIGDPDDESMQLLHRCWLAYISDDLPTAAVIRAVPEFESDDFFAASLDHTIWFHGPVHADRWHLYDMTCHHFTGGRGVSIGHVFDRHGGHVATIAQEVLVRRSRG